MNPSTRVSIHCYAGDAHQMFLPLYAHHECPFTVISPEDSRAEIEGVDCQFAGLKGYIGQVSLDRQIAQMKLLLATPENHFLMHDSDSVCLDAKLPDYLYAEPDVVWSNQVFDNIPEHQPYIPEGWPKVAFQPPYFLSRATMEKMVAVAEDPRCQASPCMPFIDFFMVQLTMVAGLEWRRFPDCMSFGICADPLKKGRLEQKAVTMYTRNTHMALNVVRNEGVQIIHSVKDPEIAEKLYVARRQYLGDHDASPRHVLLPQQVVGGDALSRSIVFRRQQAGRNTSGAHVQTGAKA